MQLFYGMDLYSEFYPIVSYMKIGRDIGITCRAYVQHLTN